MGQSNYPPRPRPRPRGYYEEDEYQEDAHLPDKGGWSQTLMTIILVVVVLYGVWGFFLPKEGYEFLSGTKAGEVLISLLDGAGLPVPGRELDDVEETVEVEDSATQEVSFQSEFSTLPILEGEVVVRCQVEPGNEERVKARPINFVPPGLPEFATPQGGVTELMGKDTSREFFGWCFNPSPMKVWVEQSSGDGQYSNGQRLAALLAVAWDAPKNEGQILAEIQKGAEKGFWLFESARYLLGETQVMATQAPEVFVGETPQAGGGAPPPPVVPTAAAIAPLPTQAPAGPPTAVPVVEAVPVEAGASPAVVSSGSQAEVSLEAELMGAGAQFLASNNACKIVVVATWNDVVNQTSVAAIAFRRYNTLTVTTSNPTLLYEGRGEICLYVPEGVPQNLSSGTWAMPPTSVGFVSLNPRNGGGIVSSWDPNCPLYEAQEGKVFVQPVRLNGCLSAAPTRTPMSPHGSTVPTVEPFHYPPIINP